MIRSPKPPASHPHYSPNPIPGNHIPTDYPQETSTRPPVSSSDNNTLKRPSRQANRGGGYKATPHWSKPKEARPIRMKETKRQPLIGQIMRRHSQSRGGTRYCYPTGPTSTPGVSDNRILSKSYPLDKIKSFPTHISWTQSTPFPTPTLCRQSGPY